MKTLKHSYYMMTKNKMKFELISVIANYRCTAIDVQTLISCFTPILNGIVRKNQEIILTVKNQFISWCDSAKDGDILENEFFTVNALARV